MAPAKQLKIMQDFQKQSAQMDMTVRLQMSSCLFFMLIRFYFSLFFISNNPIKWVFWFMILPLSLALFFFLTIFYTHFRVLQDVLQLVFIDKY